MKRLFLTTVILTSSFLANAQLLTNDFGSCFSKSNRKSIDNKMNSLLNQVSEETGCSRDSITYAIDEYYTVFYSEQCRHLPKRITFDIDGVKRTYSHNGLSGAILYWLLGTWSLVEN